MTGHAREEEEDCFSLGGPRYKPYGVSRGSLQLPHFNEMYHNYNMYM